MPIYEYFCADCQKPFEVFVRSLNTSVTPICPECGGQHVEKQVTAAQTLGGSISSTTISSASCAPSG